MSEMKPTIGRRVWLWAGDESGIGAVILDPKQALDAGVVYVHEDGTVNLDVTDHRGNKAFAEKVTLQAPTPGDCHGGPGSEGMFATWMPYQVGQAATQAAQKPAAKGQEGAT